MRNRGGIKFTNISSGMIIEVVRLPDDESGGGPIIMGKYLVVTTITSGLLQRYNKPMMEVRLANGQFTNSSLTFWSPNGGISMYSFPGRKGPFKFKIIKLRQKMRGI